MAGEAQDVGGIALPLTVDPTGGVSGLKRFEAEYDRVVKKVSQGFSIGVAANSGLPQAARARATAVPLAQQQEIAGVRPSFTVSARSARDLRIDINQQLRQLASQGEAVQVPIKLGRVPYGQFQREISAGIGEVPIRVTLSPATVAQLKGQILQGLAGASVTPGGGGQGGRVQAPRRAMGGPVYMAGGGAARYTGNMATTRLTPQQADFYGNIKSAAMRLQPHHIKGGVDWYRDAGAYGRQQAAKHGVPVPRAIGALAALSAGTEWNANKTKFEKIIAAHATGQPFPYSLALDAHRKAQAILQGTLTPKKAFSTSPKVSQFYQGLMGDPSTLTVDLWATRTATRGGLEQPGRGKTRKGIEDAFKKVAREHKLKNAELQAALWLLEKEESTQAPGQIGLGFAKGGQVRGTDVARGYRQRQVDMRAIRNRHGAPGKLAPADMILERAQLAESGIEGLQGLPSMDPTSPRYARDAPAYGLHGDPRQYGLFMPNNYPVDPRWLPELSPRKFSRNAAGGRARKKPRWTNRKARATQSWQLQQRQNPDAAYDQMAGSYWPEMDIYPETLHPPFEPPEYRAQGGGVHKIDPSDLFNAQTEADKAISSSRDRDSRKHLSSLRKSMTEEGLRDPVKVRVSESGGPGWRGPNKDIPSWQWPPGTPIVWDGNHRVAAARQLGWDSVPTDIRGLESGRFVSPRSLGWKPRAMGGGVRGAMMKGAGYVPGLRGLSQQYNRMVGLPPMRERYLHPLDVDFSQRTARAYEAMPVGPDDLSRKAYRAFAEETGSQYEFLQRAGFRFEPDPGDPYHPVAGGPTKMQLAAADVRKNRRLLAFSSALEHPLLSNEENLQFRHVHDMMGHLAEGYSIGPRGEYNAAVKHSQMYSPLARRAMLAETHGQNSVVNFSQLRMPDGRTIAETNKAAPGSIYAQQKAQVLPDDILEEFYQRTGIKRATGGPVSRSFRYADPEGLHMRPAGGFSRAVAMHNVQVTGANLDTGQELINPESIFSWMALGARKGHRLQLSAMGPDAKRVMDLFEKLAKFDPVRAGMTYPDFQKSLGIGNPLTASVQARQEMRKRAAGGSVVPMWRRRMAGERSAGGGPEYPPMSAYGDKIEMVPARHLMRFREIDRETKPKLRGDFGYLDELSENIKNEGIKVPVVLEYDPATATAMITDGNHRVAAAARAGIEVPVRVAVAQWRVRDEFRGASKMQPQYAPTGKSLRANEFGYIPGEVKFSDIMGYRPKRAAGGEVGQYIVNEIGRELFVPRRMEHTIPPDVFDQLPKRAEGGVAEIDGTGPMLWEPPEDGWIIPARLANKVPRRAAGGPADPFSSDPNAFGGGGYMAAFEEQERRRRSDEVNRRRDAAIERRRLTEARRQRESLAQARADEMLRFSQRDASAAGLTGDTSAVRARQDLRFAQLQTQEQRGLTGRAAFGGLFQARLGGSAERRQARLEAQEARRQLEALPGPKGADKIVHFTDQIAKVSEELDKNIKEFGENSKQVKANRETIQHYTALQQRANQLRETEQFALQRTRGGTGQFLLATSAAGIAYGVVSQALQTGAEQIAKAVAPVVDQLSGFGATETRTTAGLAQQLPAAGTLQTLFGQTGLASGLSGQATQFLQGTLGPSIFAKAGGNAAAQQSELFRAALGTGAPSGLLGGFGGLGGTAFLADVFGGGKGFAEQVAGDVAVSKGQSGSAGPFGDALNQLSMGLQTVFAPFDALTGKNSGIQIVDGKLVQIIGQTAEEQSRQSQVSKQILQNFNEATGRSRQQLGQGPGAQLVDVGVGSAEALQVLASDVDEYTKQFAKAGVVFHDASGKVITDQMAITKAYSDAARGMTIPDRATFMQANRQQLVAGEQLARERGRFQSDVAIPGEFGQQLVANPFGRATAGSAIDPRTGRPVVGGAGLAQTQRMQDQLMAGARAGVEGQASFIDENLGLPQGSQFRQYMGEVEAYGQQIANLNDEIASKSAAVAFAQYSANIRILNRSIADAKGLLGRPGGSRLGGLQREQFELGRASEKLSLAAQALQIALSQRQINFQKSIAGFQAPGITGEERAARKKEAEIEANYAQQQLDIQKQQLGIAGQAFQLEAQVFTETAKRQLDDLNLQKALATQQFATEQEIIAAQRRVAVIAARQAQTQARAQALFAEATGNFDARLNLAAQFVAQFGGTAAYAIAYIRNALRDGTSGKSGGRVATGGKKSATGQLSKYSMPTQIEVGDAGGETVAILRNPKRGDLGGISSGGAGVTIGSISIVVQGGSSESREGDERLARTIRDSLIDELNTRTAMLALR